MKQEHIYGDFITTKDLRDVKVPKGGVIRNLQRQLLKVLKRIGKKRGSR